jgi:hypothetical protein
MAVTHAKVVVTADDGTSEVGSNEWNDDHVISPDVTGNITYYVRTDGSDSNTGLANTAGGAFLTIQKAVDVVQALNFGFNRTAQVTIQLAAGTYDEGLVLGPPTNFNYGIETYPVVLPQAVYIVGDRASPSSVVITDTGIPSFGATIDITGGVWRLDGLQLNAEGFFAAGIRIGRGGNLTLETVNLASQSANVTMIVALSGSYVLLEDHTDSVSNTITFSGDASRYVFCQDATVSLEGADIVFSGTPTLSNAFMYVGYGGNVVWAPGATTGDITGRPYIVDFNGVVDLLGAANPSLPTGTVASRNLGNGLVYTESIAYEGRFFYRDGLSTTETAHAVRSGSGTVAQLPSGVIVGSGGRSYVTDATTTTFLSQVVGGSTYKVPVHTDGSTAWFIG